MLKNRPLLEVKEDPKMRAFYHCGAMFALMSDAAIHQAGKIKHQRLDLFSLWSELFSKVKQTGKPYEEATYFLALNRLTENSIASESIQTLLKGNPKDTKAIFIDTFRKLNIETTDDDRRASKSYKRQIISNLIKEFMKKDCQGKSGLTTRNGQFKTDTFPTCTVFNFERSIVSFNGYKITSDETNAYDAIRKYCSDSTKKVTLETLEKGSPFQLSCPEFVPERDRYLRILSIPE